MSHNTRQQNDAFYAIGVPLPSAWWSALDTAQSKAFNGASGGTWTPAANISLTNFFLPAGSYVMWLGAPCTMGWNIVPGAGGFVHGDNDYIQIQAGHAAATRTIATPCGRFADISDGIGFMVYGFGVGGDGVSTVDSSGTIQPPTTRCLVPLVVHNGATMSQVVFSFSVGLDHTALGLPAIMPLLRVFRTDASGNVTPLKTTGALAGGYMQLSSATGTTWWAAGAVQTFTYTLDAGVVIDTSQFDYWAEINDEDGLHALPRNVWLECVATFTTIADLRFQ